MKLDKLQVDTNALKIKDNINEIKQRCGNLDTQEQQVMCFSEIKKAENNIENIMTPDKLVETVEKTPIEDMIEVADTSSQPKVEIL